MVLSFIVDDGMDPNVNPFRMPPDNDIFQRRDQERLRKKQVRIVRTVQVFLASVANTM